MLARCVSYQGSCDNINGILTRDYAKVRECKKRRSTWRSKKESRGKGKSSSSWRSIDACKLISQWKLFNSINSLCEQREYETTKRILLTLQWGEKECELAQKMDWKWTDKVDKQTNTVVARLAMDWHICHTHARGQESICCGLRTDALHKAKAKAQQQQQQQLVGYSCPESRNKAATEIKRG